MLKKTVLLCILILVGCSSPPPQPPSNPTSSHLHVDALPNMPTPAAHDDYNLAIQPASFTANQLGQLTFVLQNPNGTAAQYTDFLMTHGQRVHLMLIDPSLTDYHHMHPGRTRKDTLAIYTIPFTPKKGGDYAVFADVLPRRDNTERFLSSSLTVDGPVSTPHFDNLEMGTMAAQGTTDGLMFQTDIDQPLRVGQATMLNITVRDKEGNMFRELEPIMQAFAHLVGFSQNRQDMMHAHPMGEAVTADNARGGPNLMFHVTFPQSGYYRLFLQVRVRDEVLVIPFDARVAP